MIKIGDRIKSRRLMLNISQEELAERIGYSSDNKKSTISKIENNVNDLTRNKIRIFAQALQTSEAYLMGWVDDPELPQKEALLQEAMRNTQTDPHTPYKANFREGHSIDITKTLSQTTQVGVDFGTTYIPPQQEVAYNGTNPLKKEIADIVNEILETKENELDLERIKNILRTFL